MKRAAIVLACVTGCDPVWVLDVQVRSATDEPRAEAALILTDCPEQNAHNIGSVAALTDGEGHASVGGLGWIYPPCNVTVAKAGYLTQQTSFDELCNGNREDCDRAQTLRLTLAPEP